MGVEKEEKKEEPKEIQSKEDQEISNRVFNFFQKIRDNRNSVFQNFRGRTPIEYWDDSNKLFNNFKEFPNWKESWQSNFSDTTLHSKVLAVAAQAVASRNKAVFKSKFRRDIFAIFLAGLFQDIYNHIDSVERNGELDLMIDVIGCAREGTRYGFEGYKKTKNFEGIDARNIPLEEMYLGNMTKVFVRDQLECIWRSVISKDEFDKNFHNWYQREKVKTVGELRNETISFFNISNDITEDKIELLRYFDILDDEFYITANGINITKSPSKLSDRRNDGNLGFWDMHFEIFDNFAYGRSLPDLMEDSQEGIDVLFNNLFDRELLSTLRPIFAGAVNNEFDGYLYPGMVSKVQDVDQIKELKLDGANVTAFKILETLQQRQHFVSVDEVSQGMARGNKTATEVERAQEAALRIGSLFNIMIKDAIRQKAILRGATISKFYLNRKSFEPFVIENVKLFSGKIGTRVIRFNNKSKLSPGNKFGYSRKLELENMLIDGDSEIIEAAPEELKNFKFLVDVTAPTVVEMSPALQRAYNLQWVNGARNNQQYNQEMVEKIHTEAMGQDWELVKAKENNGMAPMGEEKDNNKNQAMDIPSLKSMITKPMGM